MHTLAFIYEVADRELREKLFVLQKVFQGFMGKSIFHIRGTFFKLLLINSRSFILKAYIIIKELANEKKRIVSE